MKTYHDYIIIKIAAVFRQCFYDHAIKTCGIIHKKQQIPTSWRIFAPLPLVFYVLRKILPIYIKYLRIFYLVFECLIPVDWPFCPVVSRSHQIRSAQWPWVDIQSGIAFLVLYNCVFTRNLCKIYSMNENWNNVSENGGA